MTKRGNGRGSRKKNDGGILKRRIASTRGNRAAESFVRAITIVMILALPVAYFREFAYPSLFPKYLLLCMGVILICVLSSFSLRSFPRQSLTKHPIITALTVFYLSYLISAIFSASPTASITGTHGSWVFSIVGMTCLFFITIASSNFFRKTVDSANILWALTSSGILMASVLISDCTLSLINNSPFTRNPILPGNEEITIHLFISIISTLGLIHFYKQKSLTRILSSIILLIIAGIVIAQAPIQCVLCTAIMFVLVFTRARKEQKKRLAVAGIASTAGILCCITGIWLIGPRNMTPYQLTISQTRTAFHVFTDRPLLGTGPENLSTHARLFLDPWIIQSDFWKSDLHIAPNLFLHIAATSGIIGLVPLLILFIAVGKTALQRWRGKPVAWGMAACTFLWLCASWVTLPGITTLFTGFLLLGTTAGVLSKQPAPRAQGRPASPLVIAGTVFIGVFLLAITYRFVQAEWYFSRAGNLDDNNSIVSITKAINLIGTEPLYYRTQSTALSSFLKNASSRSMEPEILRQIHHGYETAILLNPADSENYATASSSLATIGYLNQDNTSILSAISYGTKAISLSPNDPSLYLERGKILLGIGRSQAAISDFETAIAIKSNYWIAYLYLALVSEEEGNTEAAAEYLQTVIDSSDDPVYVQLAKNMLERTDY